MGYTGHKHGMEGTKTYNAWSSMKKRCKNSSHQFFERYGGRGISYDPRWENFEEFLLDMGEAPHGMSLDRIDNNSGYSKENCRWATQKVQCNNRSTNVMLTIGDETMSVAEWSRKSGVEPKTIGYRIRSGWDHHEAVFKPSTIKRK